MVPVRRRGRRQFPNLLPHATSRLELSPLGQKVRVSANYTNVSRPLSECRPKALVRLLRLPDRQKAQGLGEGPPVPRNRSAELGDRLLGLFEVRPLACCGEELDQGDERGRVPVCLCYRLSERFLPFLPSGVSGPPHLGQPKLVPVLGRVFEFLCELCGPFRVSIAKAHLGRQPAHLSCIKEGRRPLEEELLGLPVAALFAVDLNDSADDGRVHLALVDSLQIPLERPRPVSTEFRRHGLAGGDPSPSRSLAIRRFEQPVDLC